MDNILEVEIKEEVKMLKAGEVRRILLKAVANRGYDTRVGSCAIWQSDEDGRKHPSCVVGQALYEIVGEEAFQNVVSGLVSEPAAALGVKMSKRAGRLLEVAQELQDGYSKYEFAGGEVQYQNRPWWLVLEILDYKYLADDFDKYSDEEEYGSLLEARKWPGQPNPATNK